MDEGALKYYFIFVSIAIAAIVVGTSISEWNKMDCKLKMGQSGRPLAEINEICK